MSFITVFFEANISALKNKQRKKCIYAQKQLNKGLHLLYVSFMSLLYLIISVRKMVNKGDACSLSLSLCGFAITRGGV